MIPFAVFIVAPALGGIAATTRPGSLSIGLPGGKVDAGETAAQAALREAAEEGWDITGMEAAPFHTDTVEGRPIAWFKAASATPLRTFKEKGRVIPVVATLAEIKASGFGNGNLPL